jgi:hypothetical protein
MSYRGRRLVVALFDHALTADARLPTAGSRGRSDRINMAAVLSGMSVQCAGSTGAT